MVSGGRRSVSDTGIFDERYRDGGDRQFGDFSS